ncbi:hypothetical protein GCM10010909_24630 [Acidocella aquatica]|uniref:Phosphoglycerate mutase n=2 Tax=Acidocella aquatica TaxID=1922313 RepID=A0ABQ6A913_9PROT|nr:hypothetical protein GCM10010909_24630 [Acidocella aquatica]
MPAPAPRLALVRHGATAWTLAGRYQGRADPPLCPQGIAEAATLAATLHGQAIGQIVTSPLQRARQTAAILASAANLASPETDDNLSEISYGAWEGLTQPEIKSSWPGLLREWKHTPESARFPGGGSLADMRPRVRAALSTWRRAAHAQSVLLVTHAIWIKLALVETGLLAPADFRHIRVPTSTLFWLPPEKNL